MKIRSPQPTVLKPVRPNVGIEVWYRRELAKLVDEMHKSVLYWVRQAYGTHALPTIAKDSSPERILEQTMTKLGKRWTKQFNNLSKKLSQQFADKSRKFNSVAFEASLKDAGFAVKADFSSVLQEAMPSIVEENVNLIKSIPTQYLDQVQEKVLESVQRGRDMNELTELLEERYGVTRDRAALIARNQNNKATAQLQRLNQKEVGVTQAEWSHTSASRHPRPEHASWHRKRYNIDEGMWSDVDKAFVWPGTAINCGCTSHPVIPGYDE